LLGKNVGTPSQSSASLPSVLNACAAQHSGHMCLCEGKNRQCFGSFTCCQEVVIDLNVRRNQPQCSNFALNIRTRQSYCGLCRSKDGRCRGTNGNSSYIFSTEKCTFIIKYSKVWKWCRTFRAIFFALNVRHLTCLRSFCVEPSGQLPGGDVIWITRRRSHRSPLRHFPFRWKK